MEARNVMLIVSGSKKAGIVQQVLEGEISEALLGDSEAVRMYEEMGTHLGNAIKMMLYALDVELIILGGSVRHAFSYFEKTMWQQIRTLVFKRSPELLKIEAFESCFLKEQYLLHHPNTTIEAYKNY